MVVERLNRVPLYRLWFAGQELPFESAVNHFMFHGTTGSGKTTLLRLLAQSFIPYIGRGFDYDQRAVFFDVKQEVLSILFGAGVDPAKIHLFNPFDARSVAWDIAQDITTEAAALQFATTIAPENNDTNRFFQDAARDCISGAIITLNDLAPGAWDFRDLVIALSKKSHLKALFSSCRQTEDRLDYFEEDKTAANVITTIKTKIAPFRTIAACWYRASEKISLERWMQDKDGSFLILGHSEKLRAPLSAMNQIIFQRLVELTLDLSESDERRIWYVLDELPMLGGKDTLGGLVGLLTNGRSKGVSAILGLQDIDSLRENWGEHLANVLVGMCSSQAYLRVASGSAAQWSSNQFKDRYEPIHSTSTTITNTESSRDSSTSEAKSTQVKDEKREIVPPSAFLTMPVANAKNGIRGYFLSSWFKEDTTDFTTFLRKTLTQQESFDKLQRKSSRKDNFVPRPKEHEKLETWGADDLKRLNLHIRTSSSDDDDLKSQLT